MRTRLSSGFVRAEQGGHSVLASRTEAEGNILTAHGGLAGNNGPAGQGLGVRGEGVTWAVWGTVGVGVSARGSETTLPRL